MAQRSRRPERDVLAVARSLASALEQGRRRDISSERAEAVGRHENEFAHQQDCLQSTSVSGRKRILNCVCIVYLFDDLHAQVGDWDDRMKSVKWVPLDLFVPDQADRALAAGESATDLAVGTAAASVPEAGQRVCLRTILVDGCCLIGKFSLR